MTETFTFDGAAVPVSGGQTVAAALWQAGVRSWRTTRISGSPRGIFCGIGACFDCLATVDGATGQRLCVTPASAGMVVTADPVLGGAPATTQSVDSREREERVPASPAVASKRGYVPVLSYDVVVVGAGPAGLGAAAAAALGGARVALLDAGPRVGGQFWRHRDGDTGEHGYRDWSVFTGLQSIVEERVDHVPDATVWWIEPGPPIRLHTANSGYEAPRVVLATGAYDRALPFPGWDLPGVVTPGAAQALLKGSSVAVGRDVVVAGAGPFLLPVAVSLAEAGVHVVGVFEAGDPRAYLSRLSLLPGLAGKVGEAAGYAARLARHRVPYRVRHAVIAARPGADGAVSGVDVARLDRTGRVIVGSVQRLACDAVAVGYGFTANLELALALGCGTRIGADGGLALLVGDQGQTTVAGVFAAGEITGVGGSALAVVEGELAGAAAAEASGFDSALSTRDRAAARRKRDRLRAFADLMHAAHAPPGGWPSWLEAETLVCRCEEVSYSAVVDAVGELGATDGRSVKLLARPGMGWCQGRTCGYATAVLTARACGRPVTRDDFSAFAHRPFATPVRLAQMAALAEPAPEAESRS
jgi:D-hydroxyproline dehydrogenase subunit alpha